MVFQSGKFILDLDCQLSGRAHEDGFDLASSELALFPQVLCQWQRECQRLSGASQVSRNDVFPIVDRVETVHLDREEVLVSTGKQLLGGRR